MSYKFDLTWNIAISIIELFMCVGGVAFLYEMSGEFVL